MPLFRKTNKNEPAVDYTKWETDFGFLNLVITRKKNITKEFLISTYSTQMKEVDYLKDEDIEPIVERIVNEVTNQISDQYKKFLINKYFGNIENLISFIAEDVYVDLVSDSINRNTKKIVNNIQKKILSSISNLNNKK